MILVQAGWLAMVFCLRRAGRVAEGRHTCGPNFDVHSIPLWDAGAVSASVCLCYFESNSVPMVLIWEYLSYRTHYFSSYFDTKSEVAIILISI